MDQSSFLAGPTGQSLFSDGNSATSRRFFAPVWFTNKQFGNYSVRWLDLTASREPQRR
jgi:hypothetical protein